MVGHEYNAGKVFKGLRQLQGSVMQYANPVIEFLSKIHDIIPHHILPMGVNKFYFIFLVSTVTTRIEWRSKKTLSKKLDIYWFFYLKIKIYYHYVD